MKARNQLLKKLIKKLGRTEVANTLCKKHEGNFIDDKETISNSDMIPTCEPCLLLWIKFTGNLNYRGAF